MDERPRFSADYRYTCLPALTVDKPSGVSLVTLAMFVVARDGGAQAALLPLAGGQEALHTRHPPPPRPPDDATNTRRPKGNGRLAREPSPVQAKSLCGVPECLCSAPLHCAALRCAASPNSPRLLVYTAQVADDVCYGLGHGEKGDFVVNSPGAGVIPGHAMNTPFDRRVVHSIVACELLSFVPIKPRFTRRSCMSAGPNRAHCRETCSGSTKLN